MENLQYTFEEWKEGKFSIFYFSEVPKLLGDDIVQNQIPSVNWQIISKNEEKLIKVEQRKIHKSMVDEGFNCLVNCFRKRVDKSQISNILIDSEIKAVEKIVEYSSFINEDIFYVDFEVIRLDSIKIEKIQKFIYNLNRGIDLNTDYISFPKSWSQRKWSNYNIVVAETIWLYYNWLKELLVQEYYEIKSKDIEKKSDKYLANYWFIVGLAFAKGEIGSEECLKSSSELARAMGNKNFRPYLSESINNSNVNDKNVFSDSDKINKIILYCEEENIEIDEYFFKKVKEGATLKKKK